MGGCCNKDTRTLKNSVIAIEEENIYAVCILESSKNEKYGRVLLHQANGKTKIQAKVKGLTKGKHGFHIHEFGNLLEGCKTAGAHYNPDSSEHGGPLALVRHVGDLGNIESTGEHDEAVFYIEDHLIKLSGPQSVIGRSCVLHADEDDLGNGGHPDSKLTGHAGARLACGVIALSAPFEIL